MDDSQENPFSDAFARLARHIADVMLRHEMSIAEGTELLKRAMVRAALEAAGPEATDSHLSLVTGVHRKDIKRLRAETPEPPRRSSVGGSATVLAVWAQNPAFQSAEGAPVPLPRKGKDGAPGFDKLVRAARVDLPPATVLAHLIEDGAVSEADGALHLQRTSLGMGRDDTAKLEAFARNAEAHLAAGAANLETSRHFERALHVNQLSEASVARLQDEAAKAAQQMLERLNRLALELQDQDQDQGAEGGAAPQGRIAVGSYVFGQGPEDKER